MTGLLFVASPAIYPLSYIGIAIAHLTIRNIHYRVIAWKKLIIDLFTRKK
jgi:hypothetical protein